MQNHNEMSLTGLTADSEHPTQTRTSRVFAAFRRVFEEGETGDFLSLVSEDFHFTVPLALIEWNGEQVGSQRFEQLMKFEREHLAVRLIPVIEMESEHHGMVVFRPEGMLDGVPYSNEITVVFEYKDDQIRSFREYVGSTQYLLNS